MPKFERSATGPTTVPSKVTRKTNRRRVAFKDGWNIKPDMVIEMPKDFNVPATGTVAYQNVLVKVNFPEDIWVIPAEMRAGNRQVLHHGRVLVRPPGHGVHERRRARRGVSETGSLAMQKPALPIPREIQSRPGPSGFRLFESAKFIPKGSDLVFNMHYTSVAKPRRIDRKLGLVFAKNPPKLRYFMHNGPDRLRIGDPSGRRNAKLFPK